MKVALLPNRWSTWLRDGDGSFRLVRSAGTLTLIQAAGLAIGYLSQILFARWLGTREYGIYAYVVGWAAVLAALPTLGLPDAALRFVPEYVVHLEWARLRGFIRGTWGIALGLGIAFGLISTALVVGLNLLRPIDYWPQLILGLWTVPLLACVNLQIGLSRGLKQVAGAFAPNMVLRPLLLVVAAFLLLTLVHTLTSLAVLAASLATLPLVVLIQFVLFRRDVPANLATVKPAYDVSQWLGVGFPLLLINACSVAILQSGLITVGAFLGPVDAGLFNAAFRTANLLTLILAMTNAVAAPLFVTLHIEGKQAELQRLTSLVTLCSFGASLLLACLMILLAEPALGLFGRDFLAARLVLAILTVGQLVNTGTGPAGTLLNMTGRQRASLQITFWTLLAGLALSVVGVYLAGIVGAAVAAAITMMIWQIWLWRTVLVEMRIDASIFYALGLSRSPEHSQ